MKRRLNPITRRSRFSTHINSTSRLTALALIVFAVSVLLGYTATATAPALLGKIQSTIQRNKSATKPQNLSARPVSGPASKTPLHQFSLASLSTANAVVYTDKANYFPGETAQITGSGFWPNEVVTIQIVHIDGTAEGGEGHEPFTVVADANGGFTAYWFVNPDDSAGSVFQLTATGQSSGLIAKTTFTDGSANLDTCANGTFASPEQCTGANWENGNLNSSKSHYFEGDSIPYRTVFDSLIVGHTYTITIEYDTTQGGLHALDYLTSFDRTEPTPGNNPCTQKQGGSIVNICDPLLFVTTPIPVDPNVTNGQNGVPGGGDDIAQIPGVFTLFGGNTMSIVNPGTPYTLSGSYAGNSSTSITVQFNATATTAVLAWGGHISTRLNWGVLNSAISINGSPYHMRLTELDCSGAGEICNVGNQDHQLSADAVFFPIELTIIKETNPDDAQTKQFNYTTTGNNLGSFSLTPPNGTTPAQTQFNLLDTTARTVTESDPHAAAPEFNLTNLACSQTDGGLGVGSLSTNLGTRTVSFTPKEGQFISCTFTNTEDQNATRGKIIVDKVTLPSDATLFEFTPGYNGGTKFYLADATTPNDSGLIVPGTYSVAETVNADYVTTATCTSNKGDAADDPSAIHLAAGEIVTCTFTNTKKPKLKLVKTVTNDAGGTAVANDWDLTATGSGGFTEATPAAADATFHFVTVGVNYALGETGGPSGYTMGTYSCSKNGGGGVSGNSITLAAGDSAVCTVNNNDNAPQLKLVKTVTNDGGGTAVANDWDLTATGSGGFTELTPAAADATFHNVTAAISYALGETGPSGYTMGTFSCVKNGGGAVSGNSITLALGDSAVCTVNNDDKAPKLKLIKTVTNDNGGTAVANDWDLTATGSGGFTELTPAAANATFHNVTAGVSYALGETGPTGYSMGTFSCVTNGGGAVSGNSVTLALGDYTVCTVNNNDIAPTLTVIKDIVPDSDTGKFDLKIDTITYKSDAGDGGSTGAIAVNAGNHTVSEAGGTNTTLSDYVQVIGGDCATNGTVSLALAQNKTCTITNTKKGMAKVVKTFNGGALGANTFTFQIRSGASAAAAGTIVESGIANAGNSGTINFATKLVPGQTYQMCEQMQPGWLTTLGPPLYSVFNPSGDNSVVCTDFTVAAGETKTFNINNQPPPGGMGLTIGFWKNWASCANSNGGQKPTLDRTVNLKTLTYGSLTLTDTNASPDVASICSQLVNLLNKTTINGGKKMASDPIFNMVAQLVAADLNGLAGAGVSVNAMAAINCAHTLLTTIHFNGNTYDKPLSAAQINQANCLATALDKYNNNQLVGTCAGCP